MILPDKLDALLLSLAGAQRDYKAEWEWDRYLLDGRMFAAACRPDARHAPEYANRLLLTLKCDPLESEFLRAQYADILPGFYMDKKNWISVCLDGAVPGELVERLCRASHALILAKLSKKRQREIAGAGQS